MNEWLGFYAAGISTLTVILYILQFRHTHIRDELKETKADNERLENEVRQLKEDLRRLEYDNNRLLRNLMRWDRNYRQDDERLRHDC